MTTLLRVGSDFHMEFYSQYNNTWPKLNKHMFNDEKFLPIMENEKEQILLLAGDILMATVCERYSVVFDRLSERFKKVIIVMGNHEHYKSNFLDTYNTLYSFYSKWSNITICDNEVLKLDDNIGIFAGTLWTDFNKGEFNAMHFAKDCMADFRIISYGKDSDSSPITHFSPQQSIIEHYVSLQKLKDFLKLDMFEKKVVMTHHAPSFKSSADRFKGSLLNSAFATNLEQLIVDYQPELWLHGHMHNNSDYMIGDTRVVCNPYAYRGENPSYDGNLVVAI